MSFKSIVKWLGLTCLNGDITNMAWISTESKKSTKTGAVIQDQIKDDYERKVGLITFSKACMCSTIYVSCEEIVTHFNYKHLTTFILFCLHMLQRYNYNLFLNFMFLIVFLRTVHHSSLLNMQLVCFDCRGFANFLKKLFKKIASIIASVNIKPYSNTWPVKIKITIRL